jgi:Mce-associated membrane protein
MTPRTAMRGVDWSRVLVYGLIPGLMLILAMAAGFLKWQDTSIRDVDLARREAVQAARAAAVTLMSFRPDTVEHDVEAARNRLTGQFRDTYTQVTREVLIPDAQQRQVSAVARIAAAAPESVTQNHAVVLVYADQTVTAAGAPPTNTISGIRVTLDRIEARWLVSGWEPV